VSEPSRVVLRLLAPVPVSLCLRPGRINLGVTRTLPPDLRARTAELVRAEDLESLDPGGTEEGRVPRSLYDQLAEDDFVTEQALVQARWDLSVAADLKRRLASWLEDDPVALRLVEGLRLESPLALRFYGRGGALVEIDASLPAPEATCDGVAALERAGNRVLQALCELYATPRMEALARRLAADPITGELFEACPPLATLGDEAGSRKEALRIRAGWPLWVTRTLFAGGPGAAGAELLQAWVAEVGASAGDTAELRSGASAGTLRWLNYVLPDAAGAGRVRLGKGLDGESIELERAHAWQAARLCQALYAAAELDSHELGALIGAAFAARDARRLEVRLRRIIWRSQTLSVQRRELQKLLHRGKRRLFDAILHDWDFDRLLEDIEQRSRICREQLDLLHQRESSRSSYRTELILFAIGAVAILEATLALSSYVRSAVADATLGPHRAEIGNSVVRWFVQVSTAELLAAVALLVLGVFLIYSRLRARALRSHLET